MTAIEWTDKTWNPVTGCTKVSPGCAHCYAERMTERFDRQKFSEIVLHPSRLNAPLHWRKPRRVFVNSMSDLFHEDIPSAFILDVFSVMNEAKQHTFQVLTKRAGRMLEWVSRYQEHPAPNIWLGVSCEDQPRAAERIPFLVRIPAVVRFVSLEPLLGPIDLSLARGGHDRSIGWVIVGGESGPKARTMSLVWLRHIVERCRYYGIPVFVKQDSGRYPGMRGRIPDDLWVREFPR